jgi:hypothetical protein
VAALLLDGDPEARLPQPNLVREGPARGLEARVDPVRYGAALHEDDGVMPVPSRDGCRQPEDVTGFGAAGHQLEAHRREVVTLVHDERSTKLIKS